MVRKIFWLLLSTDLMPFVNCHQNFTFAFEASLIGQIFIFWTISQLQAVIDRYTSKPERCFLFYNHLINFFASLTCWERKKNKDMKA